MNIFNCQSKSLTRLPETVLQNTDWLLLSGNSLGSLKKAPGYLKNITLLDLSTSEITEIDEAVMEVIVKSVKHLDIRGNNLKNLPQIIKNVAAENKLWISGNPYECNCDTLWMKDWLMDTRNIMDKDNVTCSKNKVKGKIKQNNTPQEVKEFQVLF